MQVCEQFLPGYYSPGLVRMFVQVLSVLTSASFLLQHAFQIDALILKALLARYLPNIMKFMDVSEHVASLYPGSSIQCIQAPHNHPCTVSVLYPGSSLFANTPINQSLC